MAAISFAPLSALSWSNTALPSQETRTLRTNRVRRAVRAAPLFICNQAILAKISLSEQKQGTEKAPLSTNERAGALPTPTPAPPAITHQPHAAHSYRVPVSVRKKGWSLQNDMLGAVYGPWTCLYRPQAVSFPYSLGLGSHHLTRHIHLCTRPSPLDGEPCARMSVHAACM